MKNIMQPLQQKWQLLPARDKLALVALFLFLFVVFGIYGGWQLHLNSQKQQQKFDKKVGEYFWLRSQSANLKDVNSSQSTDKVDGSQAVSELIKKFGIQDPNVAVNGENTVQFNFQTGDQMIIDKTLNEMLNSGFTFKNLQISQDNSQQEPILRVDGIIALS